MFYHLGLSPGPLLPLPPLSPLFVVPRTCMFVRLMYSFESVVCAVFSLWCAVFVVCLVPSFRYTTARFRELSLAPLALARSARCSSLGSLQRVWPVWPDPPLLSQRTKKTIKRDHIVRATPRTSTERPRAQQPQGAPKTRLGIPSTPPKV